MNIIKKFAAVVTAVVTAFVCCLIIEMSDINDKSKLSASAYSIDLYADNVAALVNEYRASKGLQPLKVLPLLQENAQTRADEVSENFSHTRPNGGAWSTAISSSIAKRTSGENIAYGATTPEDVLEQWKKSSGHNANLLNREYTHIGVGVRVANGTVYWSQLFIGTGITFSDEYTPVYTTNETPSETQPPQEPVELASGTGDVNFDGRIDSKDAVRILVDYAEYLIDGQHHISLNVGDVNSDGSIDSKDAVLILIFYAQNLAKIS